MKPYMVIDVETFDPWLEQKGNGVYRKDGCVLGVAVYAPYLNIHEYYNMAHQDCTDEERRRSIGTLQELFNEPCDKVFHNAMYDLDWLINSEGFTIKGRWEDTIDREVLLNAYRFTYGLDALCKDYGIAGKDESALIALCERRGYKGPVQKYLGDFDAKDVAPYAKQDVKATGGLYERQQPRLEAEDLLGINDLECRLKPLLVRMKKRGVRIDEQRRAYVASELERELLVGMNELRCKYGFYPNLNSPQDMARIWEAEGIPMSRTAKGNLSFNKEVLTTCPHPIADTILGLKHTKTILNNFINGSFLDYQINGRIHTTFYPMRKDDGGTITGRFSSRDPNLQQVPSKEETRGPLIRSVFVPDEGYYLAAPDFSQIEYRLLVHYATGPGAEEARAEFVRNPNMSYHKFVQNLLVTVGGDSWWGTDDGYKYTKNFNFGMIYGMGPKGFSSKFNKPLDWCRQMYDAYYEAIPYVRPTCKTIMNTAVRRGYLRTVLGRKCRLSDEMRSNKEEFKLVNYLIQGSAADVNKKAMVDYYEAGLDDVLQMLLTVHDENPVQVPDNKIGTEALKEFHYIMEHAVECDVPLLAQVETGMNWGTCSTEHWEAKQKEYCLYKYKA